MRNTKKMHIRERLGRRLLVAVLAVAMLVTFMPGAAFAERPAEKPGSPITEADVGDCSEIDAGVAHHGSTGVASCIAALKHTRTQLIALISDLDDFKANNPGYDWGTDGDDPERIIEELYGRYKDYYDALRGYYEANDEIGAATNWDEYAAATAKQAAMLAKISGEESDLLKEFVEGSGKLTDAIEAAKDDISKPTPPVVTPEPPKVETSGGAVVVEPPKVETPGGETKTFPNVVKIRTPLKTVYLTKNKTYKIPYVLDTLKGKPIQDAGLKAASSKAKIAKIVKSGTTYKIKALKAGKTVVTIKAQNGKAAKIKVVVQKKKAALKKFTVKVPKTLKKGKTYQVKISKLTKKASNISTVTFKSSKKKIASVDKAGKITALKKGKVKITIKVGSKKLATTLTVK